MSLVLSYKLTKKILILKYLIKKKTAGLKMSCGLYSMVYGLKINR